MRKGLLIYAVLMLPLMLSAQGGVIFQTFVDAKQAVLDSYFEVTFTLKNGEGRDFRPPSFDDFIVASGPSRAVRTTIVNGQYSSEMSYTYVLQPKKTGKFTIGAATVKVNNSTYRTEPVAIEVIEGRTSSKGDASNEVFVKAEPSVTEAFVGQQITLDYKLYTTINIDNYNIIEEAGYSGFFAQDVRRYDSRVIREVIGGTQFVTKVLKRVALFPQQAGTLTIEPMTLQLGMIVDTPGNRNNFFFNKQVERIPARTEPVSIKVNALPADSPPSFTGAVGKFEMTASLNRPTLTTDDAISLRLTVSGNGDIKRVQAPPIVFPDEFDLYDPRIVEESTFEMNGELSARKVFEYMALPREPGNYQIRPEFSYFDPDSAEYVVFNGEAYDITVRQGSIGNRKTDLPVLPDEPHEDIRFIKLDGELTRGGAPFFGSPLFWGLTAFPFVLFGGVLVFKRRQDGRRRLDPAILKSRRARKMAQQRLAVASKHMNADESRAFYDEVSKAMLGYVCDKLQIPRSELTKSNVQSKLHSLQVSPEQIDRFMKVIQTTETALFAGMDNSAAMNETYRNAVELLAGIETALG
jgi:hypothetical protein